VTPPGSTNLHPSSALAAAGDSVEKIDERLAFLTPNRAVPHVAKEFDELLARRYRLLHPDRD
jgi:hypothetical protein